MQQNFLSFWTIFCPIIPLTTWKIKILYKMRKPTGDIIILHMRTINYNHMMYVSWDMERSKYFFVILDCFLPFYPPNGQKNKNFKNVKQHLVISSFYTNKDHMMYSSWDMVYSRQTVRQKKWHKELGAPSNNSII